MNKTVNQQLKDFFLRSFNNAKKMREAEEKQNPFAVMNGKIIDYHLCQN